MTASAGEFAHEVDPALGHPAVGQVDRQLHREPHDLHAVEAVAGRHARSCPGVTTVTRVAPTRQMAVDVVDVGGLGIGRVLRDTSRWDR